MLRTLSLAAAVTFAAGAAFAAEDWKAEYDKDTIAFGVLSGENEKDRIKRYTPMKAHLEDKLGLPVEIYTASSYAGVMQALAADQIEFAWFGSSSYAGAYEETDGAVEPLLTRKQPDGSTGYNSVVVVRADSDVQSLDDLKGKTLAFADPNSTSGYAVPYFNLKKEGYDPETYFGSIPFSGSHEAGVMGVVNGSYDAAATHWTNETRGNVPRMVEKGMIEEGAVRTIWKSPEITSGPLTARKNLPDGLKTAFVDALMAFPEEDPKGFEAVGYDPGTTYVPVDHERYQWIVDMRQDIREMRRNRSG